MHNVIFICSFSSELPQNAENLEIVTMPNSIDDIFAMTNDDSSESNLKMVESNAEKKKKVPRQ